MTETMANIVTEIPGPKSQALLERRNKAVARAVSYSTTVFADEAKGALIKDVDGNVFVDFAAGIGVINAGHCDEEVVKAITEQANKFIHTSFNVAMYEPYVALAEKLIELTPGKFPKKALLLNSGAEAVENAIKIARKYTGKSLILSLESSFHGRTYMAMTLTSKVKPYKDGFAPFNSDTAKLPSPNCYRCTMGCTYPECGLACAERFSTLLKGEFSPDQVAAVIIEPVQGEGGFIIPPKGYLERMQEICHENNIVFIVDEIQAGFGRTGKLFASQHSDIEPDLMTISKSLAAGMPLSAVVGKAEIIDAPIVGALGGTFCGNPISCAAGLAVIEKMTKEDLPAKAKKLGDYILSCLNDMKEKYPVLGDVRGLGAMIAVEFVKDRETKEPNKEIINKILNSCLRRGVILLSAGIFSNCIRFLPPLVMTEEQVKYGMNVFEQAVADNI